MKNRQSAGSAKPSPDKKSRRPIIAGRNSFRNMPKGFRLHGSIATKAGVSHGS